MANKDREDRVPEIDTSKYRKKTRREKKEEKEQKRRQKAEAKARKKAERRARQDQNKYMRVINKTRDGLRIGIKVLWRVILVMIMIIAIVGVMAGSFMVYKSIPIIKEAKATSYDKLNSIGPNTFNYLENTTIRNNRGEIIGEIKKGNYEYVESKDISKWITEGYIAVEDRNFKTHNGIDLKAMTRAGVALVKHRGKITQGGSTITQQVVKNTLLSQEQTYKRKITEIFLAPELEKQHSKSKIMEYYVNTNFYANNCYGVGTASKYYFGKSAKDLEPQEAAILVGLSNNPAKYNPKTKPENAKEKRDWVLGIMYQEGVLTEAEYNKAVNSELELVFDREVGEPEDYTVSYAIHDTVLALMRAEKFPFKYVYENEEEETEYKKMYQERYRNIADAVRAGGYTIYTSIDNEKQAMLQREIDKSLSSYKEKQENGKYAMQGSSVVVNNKTGMVEAIVGGRGTEDIFNRAFIGVRQPGSAIKPFVVYGPAYDTGSYYPSKVVVDEAIKGGPNNASRGYRGRMTMREALMRSTNTVAFKTMVDIGAKFGLEYLGEMGFSSLTHIDNYNGAVSLGGFTRGVTPVEMAKAMATVSRHGEFNPMGTVTKVEFQNVGVVVDIKNETTKKVYEPDTAYMLIDGMRDVINKPGGTGKAMAIEGLDLVGKTGTTNNQKDTWFVGASPSYSVVVWTGYDIPRSTGKYGSNFAGPIWRNIMGNLHKERDYGEVFEKPNTVREYYVDNNGNRTDKKTGKKDLFSQILIDKSRAAQERKAEEQRKKERKILIDTIKIRLEALDKVEIGSHNDVSYLLREEKAIQNEISKVGEAIKEAELKKELVKIMEKHEVEIEKYRAEVEIDERLKAEQYQEELISTVRRLIRELDNYPVRNTGAVKVVDNKIVEIRVKLDGIRDNVTREELERELGIVEVKKEGETYEFRLELEESGVLEQEERERQERIQREIEKAREAEREKIRREEKDRIEREVREQEERARQERERIEKERQEKERKEQEEKEAKEKEAVDFEFLDIDDGE